jgi:hypothetical protein
MATRLERIFRREPGGGVVSLPRRGVMAAPGGSYETSRGQRALTTRGQGL